MQQVHSDVIQFRGNHYEFGFAQGQQLKHSYIIHNRAIQWFSKRSHRFIINMQEFKDVMHTFAPAIWEEINGLADALHKPIEDAIREFGGYYLEYGRSGCSILAQDNYMVRNYDNNPLSYEGRFLLYSPTDRGYATIGPSMQITGRTDGMNEKGLVLGYNFINRRQSKDGFMCNMISRIVLETCASVQDAVDLLKDIPHRHSFNYMLLDKSNKALVVEASPRQVLVRKDTSCTNHFELLKDENRYRMDDSLRRKGIMTHSKHNKADIMESYHLLNKTSNKIFSTHYGAWSGTLHTTLLLPNQLKVGFTLGGNRLPFMFDFASWVKGKDINVKKINGIIQTDIPFVNMVKL